VICYGGSNDGPAIPGMALIVTDRSEMARVFQDYRATRAQANVCGKLDSVLELGLFGGVKLG
jgi:hypothetical protein